MSGDIFKLVEFLANFAQQASKYILLCAQVFVMILKNGHICDEIWGNLFPNARLSLWSHFQ